MRYEKEGEDNWIIFENKYELQDTLYCKCENPFQQLEGICPKCKTKWYYRVEVKKKPKDNK